MGRAAGVVDFTPDPSLFPFQSRWFDSSAGPVHYVDEGSGPVVLLLHGTPDWSFIYRKVITGLGHDVRCVAPDYPGYGRSNHPEGYGYTPAEHAGVVRELVDHLGLDAMVVVGSDWGGPIGLDVASRDPARIVGLVLANTWCWPAETLSMKAFSRVMGSPPMQWLIVRRNLFVTMMKRSLQVELSDAELRHYAAALPSPESRAAVAVAPKQILAAGPWLSQVERRVETALRDRSAALVFGRKDAALAGDAVIEHWRRLLPDAEVTELPAAGHFVQEDAPEDCVAAIRRVLAR